MEKIELIASKREVVKKQAPALRAVGKVPAVVYGHGVSSQPLEVDAKMLEKVYRQTGGNKIIALKVGDTRAKNVLIHDVQHDGARGQITHADFYVIKMDEVLKADVPLHFTGEATAVYQGEGTLVKNMESISVECLPGDIPESFEVDISGLDDFEKTITLADLKIPSNVKLLDEDLTTLVVKVDPPRSDEEMAELEETVEEELPEGVAEEDPIVLSEENEGDKDRRDKK